MSDNYNKSEQKDPKDNKWEIIWRSMLLIRLGLRETVIIQSYGISSSNFHIAFDDDDDHKVLLLDKNNKTLARWKLSNLYKISSRMLLMIFNYENNGK